MDTSRQLKEDLEAVPTRMSVLCWEIVIPRPQAQIRQSYLADSHDLVLGVVQFVHVTFLLRQVYHGSQQFALLAAVPLTLGKLAIAGVVGFPLALLVLLDLSICGGLFLLDGLA